MSGAATRTPIAAERVKAIRSRVFAMFGRDLFKKGDNP